MNDQSQLLEKLRYAAADLPLRRFFLPDGVAPAPAGAAPLMPYDRLVVVLSGSKREPLSLDKCRREVLLETGDLYLQRKNLWEFCSYETEQEILVLSLQQSFWRISTHTVASAGSAPESCNCIIPRPAPTALKELFNVLKNLREYPDDSIWIHIVKALFLLAAEESNTDYRPLDSAQEKFYRVLEYVEQCYLRKITRKELADKFHLSESYLSFLFKTYSGSSFQGYVLQARLDYAEQMLQETIRSVKEIGTMCGFESDIYFIRCFRSRFGISPGRYRLARSRKSL